MTTAAATLAWERLPGLAHEIALGADGSAWCLGTGDWQDVTGGGGYSLHRWNGSDWDHIEGAAVRIAVGPDVALLAVNRAHQILCSSGDGWIVLPGLAREVSVGADGSAWCLCQTDTPSVDSTIHRWNGHDWDHVEGAASKIAVGPDGEPWSINAAGNIFRRQLDSWEMMPGLAREIAIGADGSVWCLCQTASPSIDSTIHVWNGADWSHIDGAAVKIAVGAPGAVWIANAAYQIFRAV